MRMAHTLRSVQFFRRHGFTKTEVSSQSAWAEFDTVGEGFLYEVKLRIQLLLLLVLFYRKQLHHIVNRV